MIGAVRVLLHCRNNLVLALFPGLDTHLLDSQTWLVFSNDSGHDGILLFDIGGSDGVILIEVNVLPAVILPDVAL